MLDYQLLWGDLHNHNEVGYAQGSPQRSFDIAASHLDFYACTPHGQNTDGHTVTSYPVVDARWPEVQALARERNRPGSFTTFLGYEWHSGPWGHVHVVYAEDDQPLEKATSLARLQERLRGRDVLLFPHHTAYRTGVAWDQVDPELTRLVEIFSEHGCSERDFGLHPMVGHSGGPGDFDHTVQHGLSLGHRFGFTAGTDNHDGYPGGYGLGLTGVWAPENTRAAVFEALRSRRTVAVTGDRIEVQLLCGAAPMGSVVSDGSGDLGFTVRGWDFLKLVELVRDGVPAAVRVPDYEAAQRLDPARADEGLYRLRLEYGWGPMKGYEVFDWEGELRVEDGRLQQVVPCFTSDPFDELRRKRVDEWTDTEVRWHSHTSRGGVLTTRNGTPSCSANDALCLEIFGDAGTRVHLQLRNGTRTSLLATQPDWSLTPQMGRKEISFTLGELLAGRRGFAMEDNPCSVVFHRAVPEALFTLHGAYAPRPGTSACYYLRVTQENGQMAWSSPIWIDA